MVMATSCEDVTAHLMELLYGELAPGERASIEGHVVDCARCRTELASFERTRMLARQALDDAPPPRVRNALLAAAAAAGAKAPQATGFATHRPKRTGRWDWLRGRWTLPTLATVGAVAVFVLGSRLFLDPANTYDRGRRGLGAPGLQPPPAEPREDAPAPAPGNVGEVPATAPGDARKPTATESVPPRHRHLKAAGKTRAAAASSERAPEIEFAPPPPARALAAPAAAGAEPAAAPAPAPAVAARAAARQPVSPAPAAARSEESLRARADRLFAEGRWAEAAEAYRNLLRSQPASPDAERWRQRLAAAVHADPEATAGTAPAKAAARPTTTDPNR